MRVCYRQAKRIWHRFKRAGDAGLVHRSRGKPGPRRKAAKLRRQVLARYAERYPDFGPTLAAEKLQQEGLAVDHETLRRWLVAKGLWAGGRKRQQHRAWRERRECFGQMVQLDGSHHDWFEGRRDKAVLMVMVDDATNRTGARFSEEETTRAAYDVFDSVGQEKRSARQSVCGSGQHLSLRARRHGGRTNRRPGAPDAVWPGHGAIGGGVDLGAFPASQGAGGAAQRSAAGPVGQGTAAGRESATWQRPTSSWSGSFCRR